MKFFVALLLLGSALYAEQTISVQACLQTKYGHTLGGTMHSKKILEKKLLDKVRKTLPFSDEKALIMIVKKYPDLHITQSTLIIRNCKALYQAKSKNKTLFFHADTLERLEKEN